VNGSGKSGIGDMRNDKAENINKMNWWEKNVEFVHLYRSIVFIKKYSAETKLAGLSRKTAKIISQYLHPKLMLRKIKTTIKKYAVLVKK
jgi:hypothetical protein